MINVGVQASAYQALPLCSRYSVVAVGIQPVTIREGDETLHIGVRWALASLADGQHELLGMWLEPAGRGLGPTMVFHDLRVRGVESIGVVLSLDPGACAATDLFPTHLSCSKMIDSCAGSQSIDSLPSRHRHVVAVAGKAARRTQGELIQAVRRHGCFDSRESAATFLSKTLQRLDRGLGTDSDVPDGATAHHRPRRAAAPRMEAPASHA